ncbi:hypothetical protein B1756_02525 [Natrarchaeobaculum aegyptiacum]|uniref:Uncharacterized protein n=2 Tax=Natrarchaeobaculum aegyptiacum TaxID=745377 RepID=A0A2Z2HP27_9EURY|nr:hypothetical protein B1756_02525 [Natrarchaeobaculum aegyptiacum]
MLRTGAAVGLVGVAGCAAPRSRDRADSGGPTYREWVPAPTDDESIGADAVRYVDVPRALERGDTLRVTLAATAFEFWGLGDWFGHDVEALEGMLVYGGSPPTLTFLGEFDTSSAADALGDSGYEPLATGEEWEAFVREDQPRVVGVTPSAIVQAELPGRSDEAVVDGLERVERVLAVGAGERDRRYDVEDGFARLTDQLGRGIQTTLPRAPLEWFPEGSTWGTAADATDDGYARRAAVVLPDGHAGEEFADDLAASLEEAWQGEATVTTGDDALEGVVTGEDDPVGDVETAVPPRVSIGFEYDADEQVATVTHRAGDPVDSSRLRLSVDGETSIDLGLETDTLEPGNQFIVGNLPDDVVLSFQYHLESGIVATLGTFAGSGA